MIYRPTGRLIALSPSFEVTLTVEILISPSSLNSFSIPFIFPFSPPPSSIARSVLTAVLTASLLFL